VCSSDLRNSYYESKYNYGDYYPNYLFFGKIPAHIYYMKEYYLYKVNDLRLLEKKSLEEPLEYIVTTDNMFS
jgi:hypothetical protein